MTSSAGDRVFPGQWLTGIVLGVLAALLGLGVGLGQWTLVGGVLAIIVAAWSWSDPPAAVCVALTVSITRGLLIDGWLVPRPFALVADLIVVALVVKLLVAVVRNREHVSAATRGVLFGTVSFALVACASAIVNLTPLVDLIGATRALVFGPLVFLVIGSSFLRGASKAIGTLIRSGLWAQAILASWQFVNVIGTGNADAVVGSLGPGAANVLGMLALVGICFLLTRPAGLQRRGDRALAAALGVPLVASASRFALFLLVLIGIVYLLLGTRFRGRLVGAVASTVALVGGLLGYYSLSGRRASVDFNPATIVGGLVSVQQGSVPRLAYFAFIAPVLVKHPFGVWFGLGPGQYASGYGIARSAPAAVDLTTQLRLAATGLSASGYLYKNGDVPVTSQLASTWSEYGILGVAAYASIFVALLAEGLRRLREQRGYSGFLVIFAFLMLVSAPWGNVWELQGFGALVWGMAALDVLDYPTGTNDAAATDDPSKGVSRQ